jgi:hypothetical protein
MKWIILLILFSCGKQQEPLRIDIGDYDGDQRLNYEENSIDQHIADTNSIGMVRGVIRFDHEGLKEIPFSNEINLIENSKKLIVMNENHLQHEDFFSEWTKIRLIHPMKMDPIHHQYKICLRFEAGSEEVDEVFLVSKNGQIFLGKWSPSMDFEISGENIRNLLNGDSHILLKKKFKHSTLFRHDASSTIREKTYRVYFSDGTDARILYVSKDLSFPKVHQLLKVTSSTHVNDDLLFSKTTGKDPRWFSREFGNGDKVLVKTSLDELKNYHLSRYEYNKTEVIRENGVPQSVLNLNNKAGAKVFLRIRSTVKISRTFLERYVVKDHGQGAAGYNCAHYYRSIKFEKMSHPDLSFVKANLAVLSSGSKITTDLFDVDKFNQKKDGHEVFWEIMPEMPPGNLELKLIPHSPENYVPMGEYQIACPQGLQRIPSPVFFSSEGIFSFIVESYVEKIP